MHHHHPDDMIQMMTTHVLHRPGPGGGRAVPPHWALGSLGPSQESKGSVGLAVRHVAGLICDTFNLVASFHLMLEL